MSQKKLPYPIYNLISQIIYVSSRKYRFIRPPATKNGLVTPGSNSNRNNARSWYNEYNLFQIAEQRTVSTRSAPNFSYVCRRISKLVNFWWAYGKNSLKKLSEKNRIEHFRKIKSEADREQKIVKFSKIRMGMAALFDSIGSSLQIISLLLISASV